MSVQFGGGARERRFEPAQPDNFSRKKLRSGGPEMRERLADRLAISSAFLSRTDLRDLGLERRAVDAVFRALPVVAIPGYSRPLIRVSDYLAFLEEHTYTGDRVRA